MVLLRRELGEALRARRLAQGRTLRQVSAGAAGLGGDLREVGRGGQEGSPELAATPRQGHDSPLVPPLGGASKSTRVGRVVGRRAGWKKAIITLAGGASIEFYETEAKAEGQGE